MSKHSTVLPERWHAYLFLPAFGLPYASAGVTSDGKQATATCPICGEVFVGADSKKAAAKYSTHFIDAAKANQGRGEELI